MGFQNANLSTESCYIVVYMVHLPCLGTLNECMTPVATYNGAIEHNATEL